ncbi:TetR/AcrR family transcriptional regulator [Kitasatospora viridis]|uniref:TetR family transcriptional regulator n=1 Tax=Kitasatospora viridis TaxID=281105 RepID=A0A561TWM6_9ACTN|nr:TetR/AcrR family transcriptional regulator [Kitasatospora viridis]TWF91516.1 TetR family transcriptional regulator [Kitasatospora viridis]
MTTATGGGDRAAARRNRATVLSAAGEAFAERGLDVPLSEIARRAGVGAGTVYRHFPSKQALLEAVFVGHLSGLAASGERRMAGTVPPADAFFGLLLEVIEKSHLRGHLCDVLAADASWPRPLLAAASLRFRRVLTALLHAAQRAGGVRPDLGLGDVLALTVGCAAMLDAHHDRRAGRRLVRLTLDGLRTSGAVTEHRPFRDTGAGSGGAAGCEECGARLTLRPTGRPVRYCGATCRQRARRRRLAGSHDGNPPVTDVH